MAEEFAKTGAMVVDRLVRSNTARFGTGEVF